MKPKRPSLKGRGREIFFAESERRAGEPSRRQDGVFPSPKPSREPKESKRQDGTTAKRPDGKTAGRPTVKVTLWLPEEVASELDRRWLRLRAENRKATKSRLVAQALEAFFKNFKEA